MGTGKRRPEPSPRRPTTHYFSPHFRCASHRLGDGGSTSWGGVGCPECLAKMPILHGTDENRDYTDCDRPIVVDPAAFNDAVADDAIDLGGMVNCNECILNAPPQPVVHHPDVVRAGLCIPDAGDRKATHPASVTCHDCHPRLPADVADLFDHLNSERDMIEEAELLAETWWRAINNVTERLPWRCPRPLVHPNHARDAVRWILEAHRAGEGVVFEALPVPGFLEQSASVLIVNAARSAVANKARLCRGTARCEACGFGSRALCLSCAIARYRDRQRADRVDVASMLGVPYPWVVDVLKGWDGAPKNELMYPSAYRTGAKLWRTHGQNS